MPTQDENTLSVIAGNTIAHYDSRAEDRREAETVVFVFLSDSAPDGQVVSRVPTLLALRQNVG